MRKVLAMVTAAMMMVSLAACGGGTAAGGQSSGAGAQEAAPQGSTEAGSGTGEEEAAETVEPASDTETAETDAQKDGFDSTIAYSPEEKPIVDTDKVLAEITGYQADEQGLKVDLQIENRTEYEYHYSVNTVAINRNICTFIDTDGNKYDFTIEPGANMETWFRVPASEFTKYKQAAADELSFSLNGYSDEVIDSMGFEEASAEEVNERICVYPTGKTADEISDQRIVTEEECEFFVDKEQYAFGLMKPQIMDEKLAPAYYYAENKTDQTISMSISEIYANQISLKTRIDTGDGGDFVTDAYVPVFLPPYTRMISFPVTYSALEENGAGTLRDLQFKWTVNDAAGEEIEADQIEYHYETAGQEEPEEAQADTVESIYTNVPVELDDTDLYTLTATGYRENNIGFTVVCEIKNKADQPYHFDLYASSLVINQFYINDVMGRNLGSSQGAEIGAGETGTCELTIGSSALELFDIQKVDRLSFTISGRSQKDTDAFEEAVKEGNFDYENVDEAIEGKTVTVYPTGKTEKEILEAVQIKEEDCAAYVSTDNFTLGILKEIRMDNPYGVARVYFENRTDEMLYLELGGLTVNGEEVTMELAGETYPKNETLNLPPSTKGFMQILNSDSLKGEENVSELKCTVYHKEHPAQGEEYAYYSEEISCEF